MPRKKLKKFEEIRGFENVFHEEEGAEKMRGHWGQDYFGNDSPIVLELACGGGDYTLALAKMFPEQNFIGVDKKADRLWGAARRAEGEGLKNVAFLKVMIEKLDQYFGEGEVDEIWITFPDPFEKPSKANKRLTAPPFLAIYQKILKVRGEVHLKTDNEKLFAYSLGLVEKTDGFIEYAHDIHGIGKYPASDEMAARLNIITHYEKKFMAQEKPIFYLRFRPNPLKKSGYGIANAAALDE